MTGPIHTHVVSVLCRITMMTCILTAARATTWQDNPPSCIAIVDVTGSAQRKLYTHDSTKTKFKAPILAWTSEHPIRQYVRWKGKLLRWLKPLKLDDRLATQLNFQPGFQVHVRPYSCRIFSNRRRLVGVSAKRQVVIDPENILFATKRFFGTTSPT
jgi:hypothetical protein